MVARNQLEKIARLAFTKPSEKFLKLAEIYNINVYDEAIK